MPVDRSDLGPALWCGVVTQSLSRASECGIRSFTVIFLISESRLHSIKRMQFNEQEVTSMQTGFMRRMLLTSAATVALLTAPAMAVSSFEQTMPGFFSFTIDEAGTYQLTIGGATGGSFGSNVGGVGAFFSGSVYMGNGNAFSGLVGGDGVSGGGGGLSFFLSGATSAYVGGGGGGSRYGAGFDSNGVGGTGAGGIRGLFAGGGAGVNRSGGRYDDGYVTVTGGSTGPTWIGGSYNGSASGGFGGGGGGDRTFGDGGGGGGGFTGGNGGYQASGQGGTSNYAGFISSILQGGTDRRSSLYAGDLGGGFFSLTLIPPAVTAVPVPASLGLLGLAIAGLIAQSRRRKA
jgi:hypothetical protein